MAFEIGRDMLNSLLNEFNRRKEEALSTVDAHVKQILEEEKDELEKKRVEDENLIESSTKDIEMLKKTMDVSEYTKDKKKMEIKEKEALIENLKNKLKEYPKILAKIPDGLDKRSKEYAKILKGFYENLEIFIKGISTKQDLKKMISLSDEHLKYIIQINDLIKLERFIRLNRVDFKVKSHRKNVAVPNFDQYMATFLEAMLYQVLEKIALEKLLKDKQEWARIALSYAKGILNHVNGSKFKASVESERVEIEQSEQPERLDEDEMVKEIPEEPLSEELKYSIDLEKFCESELLSIIAQQELMVFDLQNATSHFLHAKNLLNSIENLEKEFKSIISEKIVVLEAWASDAYHLIFLLNSFRNWSKLAGSSDPEIKEIAEITKKKVEGFITSQYGFPKDDQIKKITSEMAWPAPSPHPMIDKIEPKY